MSKINVLSPSVFNKIAAGEVVDRPASIVKELVENSIDAGATSVTVEIKNGGITDIEVSDNGCGIEKSEIEKAFLPHATSKIETAEDLEDILTLGFRGEALASVAAVSEVLLITKTKDDVSASSFSVYGGEFGEVTETGAPFGTYIKVSNLFYNIPVRQRFLKKPKQEESEVAEIISRLILANPNIAIKFIADGKTVYNSQGTGLKDAIYAVYGANTVENILFVKGQKDDIKIEGYIGKPTFVKANRTYQTVIVNGRYVVSPLLSAAVARVYEDYMLKRAYPFFVLNIDILPSLVDVNVHPNKKEVKFQDSQAVFGLVLHTVDRALIESRNSNEENKRVSAEVLYNNPEISSETSTLTGQSTYQPSNSTAVFENDTENTQVSPDFSDKSTLNVTFLTQNDNYEPLSKISGNVTPVSEILLEKTLPNDTETITLNADDSIKTQPKPVLNQFLFKDISEELDQQKVKLVGKIFNTFIIVEVEEKVYIIDQHAAHERLLYNNIMESLKRNDRVSQPMFFPYVFDVNTKEFQFMLDNLDTIIKLGFEIEPFGSNSFKVSSVPYNLPNLELSEFFSKILEDMNTILNLKTKDMVLDHIAQTACKHAVKGGDDLSSEEIWTLLNGVAEKGMQLQCPHGRPFVIEIKRSDVDKWFKRIV